MASPTAAQQKAFPYHPFVFALSPLLFLVALNIELVPLSEAAAPAVALLLFAGLLFLPALLLFRNRNKAALFVSVFILFFFTHRDLFTYLEKAHLITRVRYLLAVDGVFFVLLVFLLRRAKGSLVVVTKLLNAAAVALLLMNAVSVVMHSTRIPKPEPETGASKSVAALSPTSQKPDIYYFILDGYARADVLRQLHRYDNTPFLNALRARGFYVADSSHSNYIHTIASLASLLNYEYLTEPTNDRRRMRGMIQNSRAFKALSALGYKTIAFPTGFDWADIKTVDRFASTNHIGELGAQLLSATPLTVFPAYETYYVNAKRNLVLNPYRQLPDLVRTPSPKLVYVHSVCPHPPFIFGPNGEPRVPKSGLWADNEWKLGTLKSGYYADQVTLINRLVLKAVDSILANSATPPVIVIHGDHGSRFGSDEKSYANNDLHEQYCNLCAVYFPGKESVLYPTVTPVNIFPLLFNAYLGGHLPTLPDRSFFYTIVPGSHFIDVTDSINKPRSIALKPAESR